MKPNDGRCLALLFHFRDDARRVMQREHPKYANHLADTYGIPRYGDHCECEHCDAWWAWVLNA